jgi:hypothetical protein
MQLNAQKVKILVIPDVAKIVDLSITVSYGNMGFRVSNGGIQN